MVYNDIFPGFPWTQAFDFAAGVFDVGSTVRADFRRHPAAPMLLSVVNLAGIIRTGDRVTVALTGAQTALLATAGDAVMFDFVRMPDDTHLGIRVTVPLTQSVTAP